MAQPNYKLRDNHAAAIGHVREAYNTLNTAKLDKTGGIITGPIYQTNNSSEMNQLATKQYVLDNVDAGQTPQGHPDKIESQDAGKTTNVTCTTDGVFMTDDSTVILHHSKHPTLPVSIITSETDQLRLSTHELLVTNKEGTQPVLIANQIGTMSYVAISYPPTIEAGSQQQLPTKGQLDAGLALKKNTTSFDAKIQNATAKTAISCDGDRYISVKSNGNKICDILEDEVNAGLTINTYNKRFNAVAQQPFTFYHNAPSGLFNLKYTDDGNTTIGQTRYGQLQIAPSNTTNLNPAVTLVSSRVNGLGTVGSLFLDSTYGQVTTPLMIAPQSLTDANANTMTMYRTGASIPAGLSRTVFTQSVGLVPGLNPVNDQDFATKAYVDSKAQSGGVQESIEFTNGAKAVCEADQITLCGGNDFNAHPFVRCLSTLGTAQVGDNINFQFSGKPGYITGTNPVAYITEPRQLTSKGYVDSVDATKLNLSGGTLTGALTLSGAPTENLHASTKKYVDDALASAQGGAGNVLNRADGSTFTLTDNAITTLTNNQAGINPEGRSIVTRGLVGQICGTATSINNSFLNLSSAVDDLDAAYLFLRARPALNGLSVMTNKAMGYDSNVPIAVNNQFATKKYIDDLIAGLQAQIVPQFYVLSIRLPDIANTPPQAWSYTGPAGSINSITVGNPATGNFVYYVNWTSGQAPFNGVYASFITIRSLRGYPGAAPDNDIAPPMTIDSGLQNSYLAIAFEDFYNGTQNLCVDVLICRREIV